VAACAAKIWRGIKLLPRQLPKLLQADRGRRLL